MNILFQEEQKFTQLWLWAMLILIALIPAYGIIQQLIIGKPFGNQETPDMGLIVFFIFMLLFLVFFWTMKLTTVVTEKSINVKFFPFVNKTVLWEEIKTAEVINYGFVGGWGIRFWTKYGTVYNVKGNMGLALELKNGKKICIGTQKPDELRKRIRTIK